MKRRLLFPVLIQFVLVSTTFAQWQVDGFKMGSPAFGVGPVSDGAGGVLLAWRNGTVNPDVYVQRLDPAGNALWTPNA